MKKKVKNINGLSNHGFGRITLPAQLTEGREIALQSDSFAALLAREPRPGEIITITDATGKEFRGRITELGDDGARCYIFEKLKEPTEPPFDLFLFQALPDKERMEIIIQKATELGVRVICPFKSRHSISENFDPTTTHEGWISSRAARQDDPDSFLTTLYPNRMR